MTEPLSTRYSPKDVEDRWFQTWESEGAFRPEVASPEAEAHVIMIPPPNVTGALHMGHGLNNTLQDVVTRFRRMQGLAALYLPGTDHAGIATQNVVEKQLAKEKLTRDDLGREKFVERVWAWKEQYGGRIISQLKKLGCSCDWTRERFTMDAGLSKAVAHAFVKLHQKGLIYQGERLINWCPRCLTALSDEEAEATPAAGGFWHLRYPIEGLAGRFLVVATTRPETMMGDTAVAVHPDDPRYVDLVGRHVMLPLANRRIPIIADRHADPEKGSGAVKITPAHDFNDFEVGNRHDLPRVRAMDAHGIMTEAAGAFAGLDRFEARKRILAALTDAGLIAQVEEKEIPLPRCYRCDTVVEPMLSKQWFVKMRPLLEPVAAAVKDGRIKFVPERYARTCLDWVEQYRDWCISRQIWWGHRIPVYTSNTGDVVVAETAPLAAPGQTWTQDPDVLDTWFSSQLWPFSTLGWPETTPDLKRFYPTDVLVTARDIIYFWVARMAMCGLEFMGQVPFHTVYITGTVLDEIGRRMSKSLGNGIDPIDMIDKYGCDAVRWSLVTLATEGQDIKLSESRFEGGRNFVNKLWNAARFVLISTEDWSGSRPASITAPEDRWVRSRMNAVIREVTTALDRLQFADAARALHEFTWNVFCDWYLELTKSRMNDRTPEGASGRTTAQAVLLEVLDVILRLLHPVAPFVTEEIHEKLQARTPGARGHLITAAWPTPQPGADDAAAEREIDVLVAIVKTARVAREDMKVSHRVPLHLTLKPRDRATLGVIDSVRARVLAMANLSGLDAALDAVKPDGAVTKLALDFEVFVPVEGLVDTVAERARVEKLIAETEGFASGKRRQLANESFVARAKPEVVAKERAQLAELEAKVVLLRKTLSELGGS